MYVNVQSIFTSGDWRSLFEELDKVFWQGIAISYLVTFSNFHCRWLVQFHKNLEKAI